VNLSGASSTARIGTASVAVSITDDERGTR
jgi:hypothetical protein